jgi:hypothetical protein
VRHTRKQERGLLETGTGSSAATGRAGALPAYFRKIFVKSSGCWLISEQAGRPLADPPHGWSRSTDQNARRPRWFWVAKLTRVWSSASVNTSAGSSFWPIIGVTPMLA